MNIADLDLVPPYYLPMLYWSAERADRIVHSQPDGLVGFYPDVWLDLWPELPGYYTRRDLEHFVGTFMDTLKKLSLAGADASGVARMLYAILRLLQEGKKVIRPTTAQCEQLADVDMQIPCEDFEMPFPALLVAFPGRYRQMLTQELGCYCPRYLIAVFERTNRILTLHTSVTRNPEGRYEYGTQHSLLTVTVLEDYVQKIREAVDEYGSPQEAELNYRLTRVVLNTCLMMVYSGVVASDLRPPIRVLQALQKVRKKAGRKRKPKSWYRHVGIGHGEMQMYQFVQQRLPLMDKEELDAYRRASGDRRPPRPHWRKGHMRKVAKGPGRTRSEMVFIERTFVRPEAYAGRLVDTAVHYEDAEEDA